MLTIDESITASSFKQCPGGAFRSTVLAPKDRAYPAKCGACYQSKCNEKRGVSL
jgi:hypothetical protein